MTGRTDDPRDGGARLDEARPVVVRRPADDRPVVVHSPSAAPARPAGTPRSAVWVVVALLLAVVAVVGWRVLRTGDELVAAAPGAAAGPAGPAPLSLTLRLPERVVAGQPATVTIGYLDGAGVYSGSQEDWGDGVGTSSLKQGRCTGSGTAAPARGSSRATHTWAEPGSYRLTVSVATYTCANGAAVEEQASRTVTVTVVAGR